MHNGNKARMCISLGMTICDIYIKGIFGIILLKLGYLTGVRNLTGSIVVSESHRKCEKPKDAATKITPASLHLVMNSFWCFTS